MIQNLVESGPEPGREPGGLPGWVRLRRCGAAVAVVSLLLAGCDRSGSAQDAGKVRGPARAVTSSWGSFYVMYQPVPDPVPLNQLFALTVSVFEADDHRKPAADTLVSVSARMPEHNHGMTLQPQVVRDGAGRFRVEGLLFHMPGRWELYVDVTRAAEMERATFEIALE